MKYILRSSLVIPALLFFLFAQAQYEAPLYASYTTSSARAIMHQRIIKNTINKNLSILLNEDSEENWADAFDAMEVYRYRSSFTDQRVALAFDSADKRSLNFQKKILELAYSLYPNDFFSQAKKIMNSSVDPKLFAMAAEYSIRIDTSLLQKKLILQLIQQKFSDSLINSAILFSLQNGLENYSQIKKLQKTKVFAELFSKNFLPGKMVLYSIQRKNRDYPGIAIIRNADGSFVKDNESIFYVPQLARSITNLPFYITNGNTPQGIYCMYGFQVSLSNFIGPTANIQLGMPVELSKKKYFDDSTITDTIWNVKDYEKLLPNPLKKYLPLYESWYAGAAGRSEIIAHGTTVDPALYTGLSYFPLTPTAGCLCTKEIWDGKRIYSDQQKLVNGLLKAGGAQGYTVVIDIDDIQRSVNIEDILPYLPKN